MAQKEKSYRERLGFPAYDDPGIDCSFIDVTDEKVAKELLVEKFVPGKVSRVKSPNLTEQHHADELDINKIIKRYTPQEIVNLAASVDAVYGDFSQFQDLQAAHIAIQEAQSKFDALPAEVRREFDNDPGKLVLAIDQAQAGDVKVKEKLEALNILEKGKGASAPSPSSVGEPASGKPAPAEPPKT